MKKKTKISHKVISCIVHLDAEATECSYYNIQVSLNLYNFNFDVLYTVYTEINPCTKSSTYDYGSFAIHQTHFTIITLRNMSMLYLSNEIIS